jgi:hypothetical protein
MDAECAQGSERRNKEKPALPLHDPPLPLFQQLAGAPPACRALSL